MRRRWIASMALFGLLLTTWAVLASGTAATADDAASPARDERSGDSWSEADSLSQDRPHVAIPPIRPSGARSRG